MYKFSHVYGSTGAQTQDMILEINIDMIKEKEKLRGIHAHILCFFLENYVCMRVNLCVGNVCMCVIIPTCTHCI